MYIEEFYEKLHEDTNLSNTHSILRIARNGMWQNKNGYIWKKPKEYDFLFVQNGNGR